VVNKESEWTATLLKECPAAILTYGFSPHADLYADAISLSDSKSEFRVHYRSQEALFTSDLIGRYNILNSLCAIGACLAKGFDLSDLPPILRTFQSVPGRLERVENVRHLPIFVDYAHTPDALEKVLNCLQEIKKGKIITVFGCGGDRDR